MKRVLIISPHFPPVNAPDMQRVRTSLPYYKEMGWEPVVICVQEDYVEGFRDTILNETIPPDIELHKIKAWPAQLTRKFGLGSLSMRSYFHFKRKGSALLKERKFDLIFFSTTMFHVIALGRYWKQKFGVPFVVDMQDPWRNDYYLNNPTALKPPKYKMAYLIDKKMEAYTMPYVDGIISVSQGYIDILKDRYPVIKNVPAIVLPFGVSEKDFELVKQKKLPPQIIKPSNGKINVVYIGAVNQFFLPLLKAFFLAFKKVVNEKQRYHFYFIGTNYSARGHVKTIESLAAALQLETLITEVPDRIPYFSALATLQQADILFIPGSLDEDYNASKIYNNVFARKPVFSMFNEKSLVVKLIRDTRAGLVIGLNNCDDEFSIQEKVEAEMKAFQELHLYKTTVNLVELENFTARNLTEKQAVFFGRIAK